MVEMKTLMMTEIKNISFYWPINIQNWVETVQYCRRECQKVNGQKRRQKRLKKETKKAKKKTNRNGGFKNKFSTAPLP